ncbi:hypothetical protein ACSBR1_024109 [Camellia fascicularis]
MAPHAQTSTIHNIDLSRFASIRAHKKWIIQSITNHTTVVNHLRVATHGAAPSPSPPAALKTLSSLIPNLLPKPETPSKSVGSFLNSPQSSRLSLVSRIDPHSILSPDRVSPIDSNHPTVNSLPEIVVPIANV